MVSASIEASSTTGRSTSGSPGGFDRSLSEDDCGPPPAGRTTQKIHDGLRALCFVARMHHMAADPEQLAHRMGWPSSHDLSTDDLLLAARELGLKAKLSGTTPERLSLASLPALAWLDGGQGRRQIVVLAQCDGKRVLFQDPTGTIQGGRPVIESVATFAASWSGDLILLTSRAGLAGDLARFDFSWFIPSLVKYRRLLGEVLVVSLFLQLFALVSPLFFQVVMDKVLVHRGLTTLDVLVIGLAVVLLFESLLTILRSFVFSHTTSRIDVELGARLFRHLLHLPLSYFQGRRVGDSVARVRELENIRSFLTGNALTLLLDVAFSVVFIAVMFIYSVPLTLIVLATLPLYVTLSLLVVPVLRSRLNEKFARGAENQSLLVEAVTGIQTVKAGALEPVLARRWETQLAAFVVDNPNDLVIEQFLGGNDSVNAYCDYALPAEVESLYLLGGTRATGNSLSNAISVNFSSTVDYTLDGGYGSDTLQGGLGNDSYIVDDPNDVIVEYSTVMTVAGWTINTSVDTVYSSATSYALPSGVENLVLTGNGGGAGTGTMFANTIIGNSGANSLSGGNGNDTLDGGAGNDWLDGGAGNDVYRFGRGSSADTIWSYELNSIKVDVLQMGEGVATGDVRLRQEGNDLLVSILGTSDSVRVMSHFMSGTKSGYQIDQIRFADGTTWNVAAIQARLSGVASAASLEQSDSASGVATALSSSGEDVWSRRTSLSLHKQILLNDDWSSWFDDGPGSIALPAAPESAALLESRVQGLIDAMAVFSASGADATLTPTGHQFTVMPVIAPQYAL